MKKFTTRLLASLVLLAFLTPPLQSQQTTERFIPIGESPGLSGVFTVVGRVEALDVPEQRITVSNTNQPSRLVTCNDTTRFWLDRSLDKQPNEVGNLRACHAGRLIEVKFQDNDATKPAEWVKVQICSLEEQVERIPAPAQE